MTPMQKMVINLFEILKNCVLEWFNQDATYNSCLYEFKDSAEFILISDWDDVLVPNSHNNYGDEFEWLREMHPQAAAFIFQRPQTTLHTSKFDFKDLKINKVNFSPYSVSF